MQNPQVGKSRDFVFTLNNYTENDKQRLNKLPNNVDYIIYGEEIGEEGTHHLQGFIQYKHPVSFSVCKNALGERFHIEKRRGTIQQAIEYCKKDGKYYDVGDPQRVSSATQKQIWSELIKLSENNQLDIIKERYPSYYFRYYEKILSFSKGSSTILNELTNEWWYGQTGTGKSYQLWNKYPHHYQKELNKWWDHYQGQDVVAIEEWCPKNELTASALKIWSDRYPFTGQIKGGTLQRIRPKKIIVLSNYTIEQCFQNPEDLEPIKRRFKQIYFPFPYQKPESRGADENGLLESAPFPLSANAGREPFAALSPDDTFETVDCDLEFLNDLEVTL